MFRFWFGRTSRVFVCSKIRQLSIWLPALSSLHDYYPDWFGHPRVSHNALFQNSQELCQWYLMRIRLGDSENSRQTSHYEIAVNLACPIWIVHTCPPRANNPVISFLFIRRECLQSLEQPITWRKIHSGNPDYHRSVQSTQRQCWGRRECLYVVHGTYRIW